MQIGLYLGEVTFFVASENASDSVLEEYAQALAFDQLRNVMQRGEAFVGFNEASIDFPPTFKYDVLRSRRSKHRSLKRSSKNPVLDAVQYEKFLTEIEESRRDAEDDKSDEELDFDGEATSVASTSYSRYTIEGDVSLMCGMNTRYVPETLGHSCPALHTGVSRYLHNEALSYTTIK